MAIEISLSELVNTSIDLPSSKSISNRALILHALSGGKSHIDNLSECDDTLVMQKALSFTSNKIDIGAAGTAMRFLTAYLSQKEGVWEITGSERMKQRPILLMVEALQFLGAEISYLGEKGFPPLRINGKQLSGGEIDLRGNISSQYISALMMIAPLMQKGLKINLIPPVLSKPYILLTKQIMSKFGVDAEYSEQTLSIKPQTYQPSAFKVESDWSAASYWYEILAIKKTGELFLKGLCRNSTQGDSKVALLFEPLGIKTEFKTDGVLISPTKISCNDFSYDFSDEPDLAQTFAVTCCLLGIPFHFKGLESLKIKETNRVLALQKELKKIGFVIQEPKDGELIWDKTTCNTQQSPLIQTYEDHRMAMAFAPVSVSEKIKIEHPEVVSKSYPNFWTDFQKAGFEIKKS